MPTIIISILCICRLHNLDDILSEAHSQILRITGTHVLEETHPHSSIVTAARLIRNKLRKTEKLREAVIPDCSVVRMKHIGWVVLI